MNSSKRKMDKLCHNLSVMQANLFEKSVVKGLPSYFFIKSFMLSNEARELDELNLESAGITEVEIFYSINQNIKSRRGNLLPYPIMRFLGYFYRSAAYLYELSSKYLYEHIPPKIVVNSFDTLHSLPIEEAIKDVFEILNIEPLTKEELFKKLYRSK